VTNAACGENNGKASRRQVVPVGFPPSTSLRSGAFNVIFRNILGIAWGGNRVLAIPHRDRFWLARNSATIRGMKYVELQCKSNFSFLEGASHAHELAEQACELGYSGFAITDRNTLAGIVRAHTAARDLKLPFVVGAEIHPIDGPPVVLWPSNRTGYANLCKLLSIGRLRASKGACLLSWHDIASLSENMLAGFVPRLPDATTLDERSVEPANDVTENQAAIPLVVEPIPAQPWCDAGIAFDGRDSSRWIGWLDQFRDLFHDRGYLLASLHRGTDDRSTLEQWMQWSHRTRVPLLATGDCLYHIPERMLLQDCLSAIATGTTIDAVAANRPMNACYAMQSLQTIERAYRSCPDAIVRTEEVASRIDFSLDSLRYEYPTEASPEGVSAIDYLKHLAWEGAKKRYPRGVPNKIVAMLKHEVSIIQDLHYEPYFLTVWDLVRFARSRNILCQGRGSAANSAVCYCLGVTSVDPSKYDLLFERFISRERNEAPDIDVDFEHQRREEVIQYVYEKYGRERAGMTAAVTTYRTRSAVRECGKAIGLSQDRIDALSKIVEGRGGDETLETRCAAAGIDPKSDIGARYLYLVQSLIGFPRHLSQHTGGMVMTQGALHELCPIENAAMTGRTIIQWDKNDLDELGILKVDCLALGMLSAIHRSFDLIEAHYQRPITLATVPPEDSAVYDMICAADTVGVFQIESRAQMSMLPRLRPRCFYDLVIEVAIVRPGPIQGQMVHPYLTARKTGVHPEYPTEAIANVLRKTMGVPIFQEQAMKLAVVAAGFTPGEADQLRRAMAAWRRPGLIDQFRKKLIEGMRQNGLDELFAERVFNQLRGFGEYGFPESHAASFALLVYASCWIKHHYPEVFCCAMINSQPLGFYAPAQLVQDAVRHGVNVLQADVNHSRWDCTLGGSVPSDQNKPIANNQLPIRLGLRVIRGLREEDAMRVVAARSTGIPFADQSDLVRRASLSQATLSILADAGALESLSGDRRAAYWQSLAQEQTQTPMPLFDLSGVDNDEAIPESLRRMTPLEEVYTDYETTGISLKGHPIRFCRERLAKLRVTPACELPNIANGRFIRVAGLILLRQRPGTAKGITFVTMEDETGSINLVIRPSTWKHFYLLCKQSNAWLVRGILENREGVIHVVVGEIEDLQSVVGPIDVRSRDFR
jgi:error-prone DNA polymerase